MSLTRDILAKSYDSASMRVMGLGMTNSYGLTADERDKLTKAYNQALDDAALAKAALEAFDASSAAGGIPEEPK
jgi:hypothetical protein